MSINHAVLIPSANKIPNPSGIALDPEQASPTRENPWMCRYSCTCVEHTDTVVLLWNGEHFSLPDAVANDPEFGQIDIIYKPPLE